VPQRPTADLTHVETPGAAHPHWCFCFIAESGPVGEDPSTDVACVCVCGTCWHQAVQPLPAYLKCLIWALLPLRLDPYTQRCFR